MLRGRAPLLAACGAVALACAASGVRETVTPVVVPPEAEFRIPAHTSYEGPSELVPRPLVPRRFEASPPFRYRIRVGYRRDEAPTWLRNLAFLLYRFHPIGTLSVHAEGVLELVEFGVVVKEYRAECLLEQRRILHLDHATPTGLRRRALFGVRRNLEAQLGRDREFLARFFEEGRGS